MSHPVLRVQLLGGFHLAYDDLPITGVNSARLQSLCAYLILHANLPQLRQHLAFLLWPDTTETQARNNLRQLLHQLRQALPGSDRFLMANTNTVCWKTDAGQVIDVLRFARPLNEEPAAEQASDVHGFRHRLEQDIAAYQGDLLPGCYEDWIVPVRESLRQQYRNTCQKLMPLLETQREYVEALQIAQRLHRLEPLPSAMRIRLRAHTGWLEGRPNGSSCKQSGSVWWKEECIFALSPGKRASATFRANRA